MQRSLSVLCLIVFLLPGLAERFHVHERGHGQAAHETGAACVDVAAHTCYLCKVLPETLVAPSEGHRLTCLVPLGRASASILPAFVAGTETRVLSLRGPPSVA